MILQCQFCGCSWRDNGDNTVSLTDRYQRSCERCEYDTNAACSLAKPGESEMAEANRLVNGERQADYGTPRQNYEGIAKVWSGILSPILKRDITPEEAALMMVGLKLQRQAMKHKRDNLVDAHGYLLVYAHITKDEQ